MVLLTWDEKQWKYVESSNSIWDSNKSSSTSFVDPSVLHDAQVNWLSQSQIDSKWGTGASNAVNNYDSTYWTNSWDGSSTYAYNQDTWYYENTSGSSRSKSSLSSPSITNNWVKTNSYVNQWPWNYSYNPVSRYYEKVINKSNGQNLNYNEDSQHYGILNTTEKTNPTTTYSWDTTWKTNDTLLNNTTTNQNNQTNIELAGNVNENMNKWGDFTSAVNSKLQTAFWMQDLNELRQKYPEQYSSLIQALDSVAWTWNSLDPSQRWLLEWQLQAIIGTAVGAWSDISKLNVLESSIMSKFKDPDRVKTDAQNVLKLQTEWLTTSEIAKQMRMSEDQVQQLVLLANGLDSKAWEYYELTDKAAKDITEDYDTQIERLEKEKEIQLERANRQIERMKQDFDTQIDRQKKANEVAAHNADFLAGQFWYWFSKRGIEWLNYVQDQAQQIIDDMVKNYDRNNQEMVDWVTDILRNWEWNNEDLLKASEDALTQAKNNYTSNMLAIQQQYGTVWMQAQQQLANNVQNFITQAETIYDNALNRQQQNLTNLITNFSNLNALQYSNLTLRNAQIQQFQNESMNLNRNQLQGLAQQLGMDQASLQDLENYQAQAVANQLNGYLPWAWVQFQAKIKELLDSWYTPNQAISSIMNSQEFKDAQQAAAGSGENWAVSGGIIYNKSTWQYMDLNGDEYGTVWNNLYNKKTGELVYSSWNWWIRQFSESEVRTWDTIWNDINSIWHILNSDDWLRVGTYKSANWYTYNVYANREDWIKATEALLKRGYYWMTLEDAAQKWIWQWKDIAAAKKIIEDKWLSLDTKLSDANVRKFIEAMWTWEWTLKKWETLESWASWGRTLWTKQQSYEGGYDPSLEFVFENMAKNNWQIDSTTQKNLIDQWYSLNDIWEGYNKYKARKWIEDEEGDSYELPEWFTITNQKLFDQATNKADITTTINTYNNLWSSAEKLKELVLEYWTEIFNSQAKTRMQHYIRDKQFQAKELYNLWVLNWPDLELMESVIYNPTTSSAKWNSFIRWRSKQDIWDMMENGINTVSEKAENKLKNYWVSVNTSDIGQQHWSADTELYKPVSTNWWRMTNK